MCLPNLISLVNLDQRELQTLPNQGGLSEVKNYEYSKRKVINSR